MKCQTTYVDLWSKQNPEQTLNGAKPPSSPGSSLLTCSGSKAFHPGITLLMAISVMLTGQLPLKSHWCPLCPKCWDKHTKDWRVTIQVCWRREQMKQISRARSCHFNTATVLTSTTLRRQTTETTICGSTSLHLAGAQHIWYSCTVRAALAAVHRMHLCSSPCHVLMVLREALAAEKRTAGALLTPTSSGFALESSKANLVYHTAAGCWVLSPSRWDELHRSAPVLTRDWMDHIEICQQLSRKRHREGLWHDPPQEIWNFWHWTQSISKYLWKRKPSLETGLSLSWYFIIFFRVRKKPYYFSLRIVFIVFY